MAFSSAFEPSPASEASTRVLENLPPSVTLKSFSDESYWSSARWSAKCQTLRPHFWTAT